MDQESRVRAYYQYLDAGEYDELEPLLAPSFVQRRPDTEFSDREAFLTFMAEDRPLTETSHDVTAVCASVAGWAAFGRLRDAEGDVMFEFIDVFAFDTEDRISKLDSYM